MNATADTDLGRVLDALHATLLSRRLADPAQSYAASLYAKGLDHILKKVGEESAEVLIAAKNADRVALVHEMVDLIYHLFVVMADQGISPADLAVELERRTARSGLAEKASRHRPTQNPGDQGAG